MQLDDTIPQSLKEKLAPYIEEGKQRFRDIQDGKTNLTFADEDAIKAGTAILDDDGYVIYDKNKFEAHAQAKRREEQVKYAKEREWEQIIQSWPNND